MRGDLSPLIMKIAAPKNQEHILFVPAVIFKTEGINPFPGMPEPSGGPKGARGLRPLQISNLVALVQVGSESEWH